jgi:geranylgeranyl diphosphate synthase, type I
MQTDTETAEVLSRYKNQIDHALIEYFDTYIKSSNKLWISGHSLEAAKALAKFAISPGKRVRGALAWFAYDTLCQKPNPKTGANLAIALELIQDYLLIVDDVMDRSPKRRGQPTVHELYVDKLSALKSNDRQHIANMMAINIGLLAQHLANTLVLECPESADQVNNTVKALHKNIIATCYGQIDDLLGVYNDKMPAREAICSVYEAKSSCYTFINPIQMGAAMAGCYDQKLFNAIETFGRPAGIAFQLQDDILGMFGDSQATGKANFDDLREGKRTMLIVYALEMSSKHEQSVIRQHLGNPKLTTSDHRQVSQIIEKCGARARVEKEAALAAQQSLKSLKNSAEFKPAMKAFYAGIIKYSINRKW